MAISRRELLAGLGTVAAIGITPGFGSYAEESPAPLTATLPVKSDFAIPDGLTYLNCAYTNPMPMASAAALREWAEFRAHPQVVSLLKKLINIKAEFAALINAKESEISYGTSRTRVPGRTWW